MTHQAELSPRRAKIKKDVVFIMGKLRSIPCVSKVYLESTKGNRVPNGLRNVIELGPEVEGGVAVKLYGSDRFVLTCIAYTEDVEGLREGVSPWAEGSPLVAKLLPPEGPKPVVDYGGAVRPPPLGPGSENLPEGTETVVTAQAMAEMVEVMQGDCLPEKDFRSMGGVISHAFGAADAKIANVYNLLVVMWGEQDRLREDLEALSSLVAEKSGGEEPELAEKMTIEQYVREKGYGSLHPKAMGPISKKAYEVAERSGLKYSIGEIREEPIRHHTSALVAMDATIRKNCGMTVGEGGAA